MPHPIHHMAEDLTRFIPDDIRSLYEVHNCRHAAQVLSTSCPHEFNDIIQSLRVLRLNLDHIRKPGGNESEIPRMIARLLHGKGWKETKIEGNLLITKTTYANTKSSESNHESERNKLNSGYSVEQITRENFLDSHKVDYVKNKVAFEIEWNSKDQTFDRDLYAFRTFHECDLIDAAVLLTRSGELNDVFEKLGAEIDADGHLKKDKNGQPKLIKTKYGASTTWMGKLLPRLKTGRNGGCPVLVFGITPRLISDWEEYEKNIIGSGT